MGSRRAARIAGYTPATTPTPPPTTMPSRIEEGATVAGSGVRTLRMIEMTMPAPMPSYAPITAIVTDSARNWRRM